MNIKKAAEETGITAETIRYYERIGVIHHIGRTKAGVRDFTQFDINIIKFVIYLRQAGLSIEQLIEYMGLIVEDNGETVPARKAILAEGIEDLQAKIAEEQKTLAYLQMKFDEYEGHMRVVEKQIAEAHVMFDKEWQEAKKHE